MSLRCTPSLLAGSITTPLRVGLWSGVILARSASSSRISVSSRILGMINYRPCAAQPAGSCPRTPCQSPGNRPRHHKQPVTAGGLWETDRVAVDFPLADVGLPLEPVAVLEQFAGLPLDLRRLVDELGQIGRLDFAQVDRLLAGILDGKLGHGLHRGIDCGLEPRAVVGGLHRGLGSGGLALCHVGELIDAIKHQYRRVTLALFELPAELHDFGGKVPAEADQIGQVPGSQNFRIEAQLLEVPDKLHPLAATLTGIVWYLERAAVDGIDAVADRIHVGTEIPRVPVLPAFGFPRMGTVGNCIY